MSGLGRLLGWVATLAVVATIVAALWVVGSPIEARKKSADETRIQNLSEIENAVRGYRLSKHKLPATLRDVKENSYLSDSSLKDPASGEDYEYRPLGDSFQLCATFETEGKGSSGSYYDYNKEFSKHPVGHYCFTLPAKSAP